MVKVGIMVKERIMVKVDIMEKGGMKEGMKGGMPLGIPSLVTPPPLAHLVRMLQFHFVMQPPRLSGYHGLHPSMLQVISSIILIQLMGLSVEGG